MSGILKTEEIADHIFEMAGQGLFRYYCFMKNISKIMLPTGINIKYKKSIFKVKDGFQVYKLR